MARTARLERATGDLRGALLYPVELRPHIEFAPSRKRRGESFIRCVSRALSSIIVEQQLTDGQYVDNLTG